MALMVFGLVRYSAPIAMCNLYEGWMLLSQIEDASVALVPDSDVQLVSCFVRFYQRSLLLCHSKGASDLTLGRSDFPDAFDQIDVMGK